MLKSLLDEIERRGIAGRDRSEEKFTLLTLAEPSAAKPLSPAERQALLGKIRQRELARQNGDGDKFTLLTLGEPPPAEPVSVDQFRFAFPTERRHVPLPGPEPSLHLVLEEDTEVTRWRRRATLLLSILGHALLIPLLMWLSVLIQRHEQFVQLLAEEEQPKQQTTFLVMPPDLLKELRKPPKTNILSDKNRIARGPSPIIHPHGLKMPYSRGNTKMPELAGGEHSHRPAAPPAPAPAPASHPATREGQQQTKMAQAQRVPQPPAQPKRQSKLLLSDVQPPPSPGAAINSQLGIGTAGQLIHQSLRAAALGRSMGQVPGPGMSPDQLQNLNPNFSTSGPIILSNTRGVDFGPYLAEILQIVRENWYAVIPESARLGEQGEVAIVFEILKDGSVPQLRLVSSSGKTPLDRAAIAGIRASIPFPPLPRAFTGRHLVLQFNFFYNMQPGQ